MRKRRKRSREKEGGRSYRTRGKRHLLKGEKSFVNRFEEGGGNVLTGTPERGEQRRGKETVFFSITSQKKRNPRDLA